MAQMAKTLGQASGQGRKSRTVYGEMEVWAKSYPIECARARGALEGYPSRRGSDMLRFWFGTHPGRTVTMVIASRDIQFTIIYFDIWFRCGVVGETVRQRQNHRI